MKEKKINKEKKNHHLKKKGLKKTATAAVSASAATTAKAKTKAKRIRHLSVLAQQAKAANDASSGKELKKEKEKDKTASSSGRDPVTGRFLHGHKFSSAPTKWTEEKAMELAEGLVKWMQDDPNHFMMGDYLIENGLWDDVIGYLSSTYPQFAEHIAHAKKIEEHRITMYAMANKLNANMAQWVLAVNHGKHNVQKTEVTGKDGAPIAPPSITIQPIAVKQSESGK